MYIHTGTDDNISKADDSPESTGEDSETITE